MPFKASVQIHDELIFREMVHVTVSRPLFSRVLWKTQRVRRTYPVSLDITKNTALCIYKMTGLMNYYEALSLHFYFVNGSVAIGFNKYWTVP